jgi:hypothetical protein
MLATENLMNLLQSSGEAMSNEDIEKCLSILVGEELPSGLTGLEFVENVLGLAAGGEEEEAAE